jgi:uncharacterized protein YegJ (DUF2314 family)
LALLTLSCDRKARYGEAAAWSAQEQADAVAVAARPADQLVVFETALYLLSPPKEDLAAQTREALAGDFADFAEAVQGKKPDRPTLRARAVPLEKYVPPDAESLHYAGRGLSPEQVKRLKTPAAAWVFDFACPAADATGTVRRSGDLMLRLARRNDALIWDEATRQVFSPDSWEKERVQGWDDGDAADTGAAPATRPEPRGIPDVSRHVTVHYYTLKEGRPPRAITLGMSKFGCPDVVMQELPQADSHSALALINAVCQTMVERGAPPESEKPRPFKVDLERLRHPKLKADALANLKPGASRVGMVTIRPATRDQGDPDNRLVELTFDRHQGKTPIERQTAFLGSFFGSVDRVSAARFDDAALNAARDRARQVLLTEKKATFRKGPPLGEVLLVKAPFPTDDNSLEWMWVEVLNWDAGGTLTGILQNQPQKIAALKPGSEVTVKEADLFDYIIRRADGTSEGNETGKILEQREQ